MFSEVNNKHPLWLATSIIVTLAITLSACSPAAPAASANQNQPPSSPAIIPVKAGDRFAILAGRQLCGCLEQLAPSQAVSRHGFRQSASGRRLATQPH